MDVFKSIVSDPRYDRNSLDSVLTQIFERMDAREKVAVESREAIMHELHEIKEQCYKTNGRVTKLERWRDTSKAKVAGAATAIAAGVSGVAWLVSQWVALK